MLHFLWKVLDRFREILDKLINSDSRFDFYLYQKKEKMKEERRLRIREFFARVVNGWKQRWREIVHQTFNSDYVWHIFYSESIFQGCVYLVAYLPFILGTLFVIWIYLFGICFLIASWVEMLVEFLRKVVVKILERVIVAGLFYGFMTPCTCSFIPYLFVAPSFSTDDGGSQLTGLLGFVIGQIFMFTSIYIRPFYEEFALGQPCWPIWLYVVSFLIHLTNLPTWRLKDLSAKIKRLVLLQLQFMLAFFCQWGIAKPDSMIFSGLVNVFLKDEAKRLLFIRTSFVGWVIGHVICMIFYVKVFKVLGDWARSVIENPPAYDSY